MKKEVYYKHGSVVVFIMLLFLSFLILRPFLSAIVGSAIIVYVFYPMYKWINSRLKHSSISSLLMVIIIFLIVFLPMLFVVNSLSREVPKIYYGFLSGMGSVSGSYQAIENDIKSVFGIEVNLPELIVQGIKFLLVGVQTILTSLPARIVNLVIMIFLMYYLFRDGHELQQKVFNLLPLEDPDKRYLLDKLEGVTTAVVHGQIVTAMVQALAATVGYFLFGVSSPIFFGLLTLILCMLPYMGPPVVYVPVSAKIIIEGMVASDYLLAARGVGLLLFGIFIVSTIDNFIRPQIISTKAKVHPGFMILGVIGGIFVFGVIGAILGPIILVLFFSMISIYERKNLI